MRQDDQIANGFLALVIGMLLIGLLALALKWGVPIPGFTR